MRVGARGDTACRCQILGIQGLGLLRPVRAGQVLDKAEGTQPLHEVVRVVVDRRVVGLII